MNEEEQAQDPELDQMLQRWAERRRTRKSFDLLRGQIMSAWRESETQHRPVAGAVSVRSAKLRHATRDRAVWFVLGVASALIAAVGTSLVFHDGGGSVPVSPIPDFAWLQGSQVSEKAQLLQEMERVFENRLEWVAETEGRVLLEVRDEDPGSSSGGQAPAGVAVRVVVAQRSADRPQWKLLWTVDLVARQEQVIRLTPESAELPDGTELALWTYAADEHMIAVDSNLSLASLPIESTFSGLQQSGIPTVVHASERDGVEYRVFQTVAILSHSEVSL